MLKGLTLAGKMVVELIKRIQKHEELVATAKAKSEEEKGMLEAELNRAKEKQKQERPDFVRQQTTKILNQSGILCELENINRELLEGKVPKNEIFYELQYGRVTLIWGSNFSTNCVPNEIEATIGGQHFSCIRLTVNPDTEAIKINNCKLDNQMWKSERRVKKALVEAFLNPERHEWTGDADHRDASNGWGPGGN